MQGKRFSQRGVGGGRTDEAEGRVSPATSNTKLGSCFYTRYSIRKCISIGDERGANMVRRGGFEAVVA